MFAMRKRSMALSLCVTTITVYNYIGLGLEPKLTARRYAREYITSIT